MYVQSKSAKNTCTSIEPISTNIIKYDMAAADCVAPQDKHTSRGISDHITAQVTQGIRFASGYRTCVPRTVQQLQHALREPWTDLRERRTALRERRTVLRERRTRCASAMCSDPNPVRSHPILGPACWCPPSGSSNALACGQRGRCPTHCRHPLSWRRRGHGRSYTWHVTCTCVCVVCVKRRN